MRSYAAIETGLPGFGVEMLADVARGGAWHIGVLAAPGIPEMLLAGRERAFIAEYALPSLCATSDAFTDQDIDELTRSHARPDAFKGAAGLLRSMLRKGEEIRELASPLLATPVLAILLQESRQPGIAHWPSRSRTARLPRPGAAFSGGATQPQGEARQAAPAPVKVLMSPAGPTSHGLVAGGVWAVGGDEGRVDPPARRSR